MNSIPNPKQTNPHDVAVTALKQAYEQFGRADEALSNLLHDAARHLSDAQTRAGSDVPAGAAVPPVDTTLLTSAVNDVLVPGHLRSIGRCPLLAVAAVSVAACNRGAGNAWLAYG